MKITNFRRCRCPACGTWENMNRLWRARKHLHHCRGCGAVIKIEIEITTTG